MVFISLTDYVGVIQPHICFQSTYVMKKIDCFVTFCISKFRMVFSEVKTRQENEYGILNDVNVVDGSHFINFSRKVYGR